MIIDTDVIQNQIWETLTKAVHIYPHVEPVHVGGGLVGAGLVLAAHSVWKDWKKKKGYRMAVRERTAKETELLGQIINDGLFEAECAGKISTQRVRALYGELSKKLNLPDLVPKQHRLPMLKEELKRKRIKEGKLDPKTIGRTVFGQAVGEFAKKFWPVKKAS